MPSYASVWGYPRSQFRLLSSHHPGEVCADPHLRHVAQVGWLPHLPEKALVDAVAGVGSYLDAVHLDGVEVVDVLARVGIPSQIEEGVVAGQDVGNEVLDLAEVDQHHKASGVEVANRKLR